MKRQESTNDKIVRLYQEGSTAERIADEVAMSVGAVNNVLERRIPGYAEFLAKKSLAMNKAKTAAKEEAAKAEAEAMRLEEEKKLEKAEEAGGMLVESYRQAQNEPEAEPVSILTSDVTAAKILTAEETKETSAPQAEVEPESKEEDAAATSLDELMKLAREAEAKETSAKAVSEPEPVKTQEVVKAAEPIAAKPDFTETAVTTEAAESEEIDMSSLENIGGDPAAKAAQKIALFAKAQIDENEAKIKALSAQIAEINEAITALKIENEQYKALIK